MDLLLLLLSLILICVNALKMSSEKKECPVADCKQAWRNFRTDIEYKENTHSFNPSNATYLGNRVNMSGANLSNFMYLGPSNLSHKLSWLTEDLLKNDEAEYITALDLSYTYISTIYNDVFAQFPCLTDLYLYGNNLTKLHEKLFTGLDNLKVLNLSSNRIASINNSETFRPLNKLEILDLSKNNLIKLRLEMLLYLGNLRQIFLKSNKINEIVPFNPIPDDSEKSRVYHITYQLRDLNLEYNRLERIDMATFFRFHLLKRISLIRNNICDLIFYDGITFPHVIYLNITHNSLPGFDAEGFRKTFENKDVLVDFNDNPILCASRQILLPALKRLDVRIREFEVTSRPYMLCKITYGENNTLQYLMNGTYHIPRSAQLQLFSTDITRRLNRPYISVENGIFLTAVIFIIFGITFTFYILSGHNIPKWCKPKPVVKIRGDLLLDLCPEVLRPRRLNDRSRRLNDRLGHDDVPI
ncbi:toll-like receptor 6 [Sitophilus oryzae]|uniref:Toll-like receptor 6 n=1 Tax=Sitophilus oryzae TaxID=7048 RepID=A0A6J2XFH9_SITOR|nr:toll-like receptor 6 [Sitophilus oryzae]